MIERTQFFVHFPESSRYHMYRYSLPRVSSEYHRWIHRHMYIYIQNPRPITRSIKLFFMQVLLNVKVFTYVGLLPAFMGQNGLNSVYVNE